MGSKGSKPVVETARQTLARRAAAPMNMPAVTHPSGAYATSDVAPPLARIIQQAKSVSIDEKEQVELDQSVVKEISKWSVTTTTSKSVLKSDDSAVMTRLNEEKTLKDDKGNLPKQFLGKLTEEQLIGLLSKSRANASIGNDLAQNYEINIESYNQLIASTKIPRIENEQDEEGSNEFLVAK